MSYSRNSVKGVRKGNNVQALLGGGVTRSLEYGSHGLRVQGLGV